MNCLDPGCTELLPCSMALNVIDTYRGWRSRRGGPTTVRQHIYEKTDQTLGAG